MKVKKLEIFQNKMGLKDCTWSSLNALSNETPVSHPFLGESFSHFQPSGVIRNRAFAVVGRLFWSGVHLANRRWFVFIGKNSWQEMLYFFRGGDRLKPASILTVNSCTYFVTSFNEQNCVEIVKCELWLWFISESVTNLISLSKSRIGGWWCHICLNVSTKSTFEEWKCFLGCGKLQSFKLKCQVRK